MGEDRNSWMLSVKRQCLMYAQCLKRKANFYKQRHVSCSPVFKFLRLPYGQWLGLLSFSSTISISIAE